MDAVATRVTEACSVVVAGLWNRSIFTPSWLASNILEDERAPIQSEIPISNLELPIRHSFGGVYLRVSQGRLELNQKEIGSSDEPMIETACKILSLLAHTPVSGVGINFQYKILDVGRISPLFKTLDLGPLADFGASVAENVLVRSLRLTNGHIVNVNLALRDCVTIDVNFHHDARSTSEAKSFIGDGVQSRLQLAERLLLDVYRIEVSDDISHG